MATLLFSRWGTKDICSRPSGCEKFVILKNEGSTLAEVETLMLSEERMSSIPGHQDEEQKNWAISIKMNC